ncbi:MAG: S9 family peptidase [Bacteroidia bacterium]|nr:S9 family peptidase [Bacteroidia bacterium]
MKKLILLSLLAGLYMTATAQAKLTPELLWKLGRVSEALPSPDGQYVLYGVSQYDLAQNKGNRDLYILPIAGQKSTTKGAAAYKNHLTDWEGNEYNAVWRPDGKKVGFLSGKSGSAQLWEINPDGTGATQVTKVEGGIGNFAYSPDGKHISFTRSVKLDKTVNDLYPDLPLADARIMDDLMYRHWDSWDDFSYNHVCYMDYANGVASGEPIDIMAGERFDSPLNPFGGPEQIAWSRDGKTIAYTSKKLNGKAYAVSTNSDIYFYDLQSRQTTNKTQGMMGYDMEPCFSPDGKKMAWLSMERDGYEADRNRIFILDLATGQKEEITAEFDQNAANLSWAPNSEVLYFISGTYATYQLYEYRFSNKRITPLTSGKHNYLSAAPTSRFLIATRQSMSSPTEIYAINVEEGTEEQLTFTNKAILDNLEMGRVEERFVKTTDGEEMLTWVIYPPDFDKNKKYPTLLYCQGGPQSAVSQFFSYRWNFQLMANAGYIVVAPNRRGLPTFGQKWNEAISGDWGGQAMKDYLSAIDAVSKDPWVDKDRLGAIGASYGGYSVYQLAGIHEKRFKTFVAHCGLYNLESWYPATEEMFFANFDLKGAPWDKPQPASYQNFSPHKLIGNWDTPILVIHGEKDFRVPVTQGMEAFNSAQLRGIPSRFLYFPEEGHWVLSPQNGVLWHRVFFDWLSKTLK